MRGIIKGDIGVQAIININNRLDYTMEDGKLKNVQQHVITATGISPGFIRNITANWVPKIFASPRYLELFVSNKSLYPYSHIYCCIICCIIPYLEPELPGR
jgi:hypothetical protein